jgi:hypothetical protein
MGEFNLTNIEILFWVLLILYLGVSLTFNYLLIKYEAKVKWVKRKSKLLESLLEDHDQLGKESGKSRITGPFFLGYRRPISNSSSAKQSSGSMGKINRRSCCSEYNKQSPGSFWGPITAIFKLMTIKDVLRQIDDVESKLTDHFKKKDEKAKDIQMSMESSRLITRSLLDQYTTEEDKSVAKNVHNFVAARNQKQNKPSTSFDELIKKSMHLFSGMEERWSIYLLLPLHAFLKDLSQLRLETEKCWRTVAEEIIKDAEILICSYLWWFQTFGILKKFTMDIPFVTHQFRKEMKLIVTEFHKLLKYNLTFFDRTAEKSTLSSITEEREITSAIKSIDSMLKNLDTSPEQVAEMNSMCDALDKMHEQLQKAEETAGRNACAQQLKAIAQELDNFLEWYVTGPELNQIEIRNAIDLLLAYPILSIPSTNHHSSQ